MEGMVSRFSELVAIEHSISLMTRSASSIENMNKLYNWIPLILDGLHRC